MVHFVAFMAILSSKPSNRPLFVGNLPVICPTSPDVARFY